MELSRSQIREECLTEFRRKLIKMNMVNNQEGFMHSSDEEQEQEETKNPTSSSKQRVVRMHSLQKKGTVEIFDNKIVQQLQDQVARLKRETQEKVEFIQGLQRALESKDEQIKSLTMGYMKDMSHIKEMSYKKLELEDVYEVKYFDELNVLDPTQRDILNEKLRSLKQDFEYKTVVMKDQIKKQQQAIE